MKTLLKNGTVVDVFTESVFRADVFMEDDRILGVGNYDRACADCCEDITGKFICPGLIDGHIHIESSMLSPYEFAQACLPHGTTAVVADPHEIANVCGTAGMDYMLAASENLPLTVYLMLPSCVPATCFDESFEAITAEKLAPYMAHPRVLGLAEMMNYVGAVNGDAEVRKKIALAHASGKQIDGHAPLLSGQDLDTYIALGIRSDHECTSLAEAMERITKGQWLMIRQGTAARNLSALLPLFDSPAASRCLLVSDDKEPSDLLEHGHVDAMIRQAAAQGKSVLTGIRMATLHAASCFGLEHTGAVAPGYYADLLVLEDLDTLYISDVYKRGRKVVEHGKCVEWKQLQIDPALAKKVYNTIHCDAISPQDLHMEPTGSLARAIRIVPDQLLTEEMPYHPDFSCNNGISTAQDMLKIAVIERHHNTGHIGLGFIHGIGLKSGAIASTVSHDSHNLIVIGTNDADMAAAANLLRETGGGNAVVQDGQLLASLRLPIAGLMSDRPAAEVAAECEQVRQLVHSMGVPASVSPFMNMAFVSLPVIPHLKLTTRGLVDVDRFQTIPLFLS